MVASHTLLACSGLSWAFGQDLFIASKGSRRRRSVPASSSYRVALGNCGRTDFFQSWSYQDDTKLIQMQNKAFGWEEWCLGVDLATGSPIVHSCTEGDVSQQWEQEPNGQGGHRWKNTGANLCLQLDTVDDDVDAVTMGFCNDVAEAGWFEVIDAFPLNQLRTVVFDNDASQRKCLSAVTGQDDLPGPPPTQDNTVCQKIMGNLNPVEILELGPVDAPLGIRISLENFTLNLPGLIGNFTTCGLYPEAVSDGSRQNTMILDMDIPEIPFHAPWFHFERPPAHGSGVADGSVRAVIRVRLDYNLQNASLECSGFDITIPDMQLKLSGGGGWELLLKAVTGAIKSIIENKVPEALNPVVCPVINNYAAVVDQCQDQAAAGIVPFVTCVLQGPTCTEKPCFACNSDLGSCGEVDAGTARSHKSIDTCAENCKAPAPPPAPCVEDEQCAEESADRSCCTGRVMRKPVDGCKYGQCGCLESGSCTAHKNNCCSLSAKRDLLCDALLGHRCK